MPKGHHNILAPMLSTLTPVKKYLHPTLDPLLYTGFCGQREEDEAGKLQWPAHRELILQKGQRRIDTKTSLHGLDSPQTHGMCVSWLRSGFMAHSLVSKRPVPWLRP